MLYSVSLSYGSDVSTQTQLLSVCTHSLFLCARELVCAISLGAHDLALHLANKRATSLPEDSETEYSNMFSLWLTQMRLLAPEHESWIARHVYPTKVISYPCWEACNNIRWQQFDTGNPLAPATLPTTVTTKEHVAELPASSINSYLTSVAGGFNGNLNPGLWDCLKFGDLPESSVAVGSVQKAWAVFSPEFACTVIPEGKHPDITGGVVSCGADPPVEERNKKQHLSLWPGCNDEH